MKDPHSDLALLIDAVARLNGRLRGAFAPARAATGLNDMEATVLLAVTGAQAPPTVAQIGRALGHPRQVIQRAANALAAARLIEFADNPDHKRASLLLPTPSGRLVQDEANAGARSIGNRLMADLDGAKVRAATALLGAIRADLDRHFRGNAL